MIANPTARAPSIGGLGWGDVTVSIVVTTRLAGLVWRLWATELDVEKGERNPISSSCRSE
jgi:hypothetical protein